nr:MAG TPA: hypothetical protein [Caudoviricetes sp.]
MFNLPPPLKRLAGGDVIAPTFFYAHIITHFQIAILQIDYEVTRRCPIFN